MLKGMKAKAEKGPRMPASIGLGATHVAERFMSLFQDKWEHSLQSTFYFPGALPSQVVPYAGLAKKRKEREQAALQQAVDAGMLKTKGAGKKQTGHKSKGSKKLKQRQ